MATGQEKFVVIGDLEGWGYSNSDMRAYLGSLSILQVSSSSPSPSPSSSVVAVVMLLSMFG